MYPILAIPSETAGTTSTKYAEGLTRLAPSVAVGIFYAPSIVLLTLTLRSIGISVASPSGRGWGRR